jgi:hypothetical protein
MKAISGTICYVLIMSMAHSACILKSGRKELLQQIQRRKSGKGSGIQAQDQSEQDGALPAQLQFSLYTDSPYAQGP